MANSFNLFYEYKHCFKNWIELHFTQRAILLFLYELFFNATSPQFSLLSLLNE